MTLTSLADAHCVIGVKQASKAVRRGEALQVYVAAYADARMTKPLRALCSEQSVPVAQAESMAALGAACGIQVGAAAVAVLGSRR